jgi:hypothetical protein
VLISAVAALEDGLSSSCICTCASPASMVSHNPVRLCSGCAGAQALVAWVLQQADPSTKLSMVAEEDSADLV